jgi:GNAT superfamily N-acetyltransferase
MKKVNQILPNSLVLVYPPVVLPGAPTAVLQAAAKALSPFSGHLTCLEAGRSFWCDYLAEGRHVLDLVEDSQGSFPDAGDPMNLPQALTRLCAGAVSHIDDLIQDLQILDRSLEQISKKIAPARIDRRGFSHPGLTSAEHLRAFLMGDRPNPFMSFSRWWCAHQLDLQRADGVVFLCLAPGQVPVAATMAAEIIRLFPQMAVAICQPPHAPLFDMDRAFPVKQHAQNGIAAEVRETLVQVLSCAGEKGYGDTPGKVLFIENAQADQAEQMASDANAQVIVWHLDDRPLPDLTPMLFALAKKGIWNHLMIVMDPDHEAAKKLQRFAEGNPNIVHSWGWRQPAVSGFSDRRFEFAKGAAAYGKTPPMPGQPVWQILQDPLWLETGLSLLGRDPLVRRWEIDPTQPSIELGSQLTYHYVRPADLPEATLEEIVSMVEAGGSVNARWVRYNLQRAFLIAYAEENGVLAGNSSLKHPRDEYISAVSGQSGIDLTRFLERGYTSVRPQYRGLGIGTRLLEGLTKRAQGYKIFSVISEDNLATQKMAIRNRTRKVASFYSQKANKPVGVWIPEWMIDESIHGATGQKP